MANESYIVVDKIKWWITDATGYRVASPLCPEHHLRLAPVIRTYYDGRFRMTRKHSSDVSTQLICAEGPHIIDMPREYSDELKYVIDRLDALIFEKTTFMYLDDIAIPVAMDNIKSKDSSVWVRAKVTESKAGLRLIVWAGDKSKKNKTQLFVEPEIQRLSFDQNDDHPMEVFAKVEATFAQGLVAKLDKK